MIIGVALQRRLEPRQPGDQPVTTADHLTLQGQRGGVAGVEVDRLHRSRRRTANVACGQPKPAEIGPGGGVAGRPSDQRFEPRPGLDDLALRCQRARGNPRGIIGIPRRRLGNFVERALGIALQQARMRAQLMQTIRGQASVFGAREFGFGGKAIAQFEIRSGQYCMRDRPGRRRRDRRLCIGTRGAVIAGLQRRETVGERPPGIGTRRPKRGRKADRHDDRAQQADRNHPRPVGRQDRGQHQSRASPAPTQHRIAHLSHADRSFSGDRTRLAG